MRLLVTGWLCLTALSSLQAEIRWDTTFSESYRSQADGLDIPFTVRSPPEVDRFESYPLVVVLNGGPKVPPGEKYPYFQVRPSRNRIWGYRTLSAFDAMQVIATMKQRYPIDANRVYLVGSSAGGSGAMHLASCFPDEFAAVLPLVAAGNNYPLRNFRNLPVAFHHGDRDWTSSICNARVQAQRMRVMGCPSVLVEYPGAGHSVPGSHEPLMDWLFAQRRDPAPKVIEHECEAPSLGRSYWLSIDEFDDPHRPASVQARIENGNVVIDAQNAVAVSVSLEQIEPVKNVRIAESDFPAGKHYRMQDGRWEATAKRTSSGVRRYEAGGAGNLYQGQPLIIVYGTGGGQAAHLRAAASKLAAYGGPTHASMQHRFPVVADTSLTAEQQARCNLILVGRPDQNAVTAALWSRVPVNLEGRSLVVGHRSPLTLDNQVLSLLHPNPDYPDRLVYMIIPFVDESDSGRFSARAHLFAAGSDGFDRISQPDLIVQNLENQIARQMQFDKSWQWLEPSGTDVSIPGRFSQRASLAECCMRAMLSKSHADFALWWGPEDKGMWAFDFNYLKSYDSESFTLADFRTQHRVSETMLGTVTGAELKEIFARWGQNRELLSFPVIDPDELVDESIYRLHIPMDLYIKLGQRKKNLGDPQPGPDFRMEELIPLIFENE